MMTIEQKNRIVDEACRVLDDLEKVCYILSHWQSEYVFNENPDPRAAIASMNRLGPATEHEKQSVSWFLEYGWITNFINVVADYVFEAKNRLEEALEQH